MISISNHLSWARVILDSLLLWINFTQVDFILLNVYCKKALDVGLKLIDIRMKKKSYGFCFSAW